MNCNYKNIFGQVNTGIHQYRLFNMAIADVIFTIIGSYIISYLLKSNFFITLLILIILGIILHKFFCVRTTLDKIIFKNV
jgi:uncharacterized membrane protein